MTPRQRVAFIESSLVIWDLLASYGYEGAGELAKALRACGEDLDDDLVMTRLRDAVLAGARGGPSDGASRKRTRASQAASVAA